LLVARPVASASGKSPTNSHAGVSSASQDGAPATSALGQATFSALIDGVPVSGGAIDGMQQQNAAYILPSGNGAAPTLLFYLFDSKTPNDPNFTHSFRFQLPKALGPAAGAHLTLNIILDPNHTARYNSSTPTIVVTSLTATRVAGTFSGKMSVSPDTPNAPKTEVTVTDGKFDIPMATSKLTPS
jgi:hypothetical protein